MWFLTFPMLVLISAFCLPTKRRLVVTAGSIALQSTALGVLCFLFLKRGSQYWKISTLSRIGTITGQFDKDSYQSSSTKSSASLQNGLGSKYGGHGVMSRVPHEQRSQQAFGAKSPER